jgi:hypothetical protein
MDDFLPDTLKNTIGEYSQRLISIITPEIYTGFQSILNDSYQICLANGETNKYLMTFQNCIKRIPKYSQNIVENECKRIIDKSGCNYLEDLLTVTHVILLKNLTTIRVGNRQKKIDISIPKFDIFIHRIYINVGRKLYQNVDLFIIDCPPLTKMKNRRIVENLIEKCILDTIRDSMPFEHIIRSYLDESEEREEEEIEPENDDEPAAETNKESLKGGGNDAEGIFKGAQITDIGDANEPVTTKVSFDEPISKKEEIAMFSPPSSSPSSSLSPPRKLNEDEISNKTINFLGEEENAATVEIDNLLDVYDLNNEKLPNAINTPPLLRNEHKGGDGDSHEIDLSMFDAI